MAHQPVVQKEQKSHYHLLDHQPEKDYIQLAQDELELHLESYNFVGQSKVVADG